MNPTTRYQAPRLEQKLLTSNLPDQPTFSKHDYGTNIDHTTYLLEPSTHSARRRFDELDKDEIGVLDTYKNGLEDLLHTFGEHDRSTTPSLRPDSELTVLQEASKLADTYDLDFSDLKIPPERYENAFSSPAGLLSTAHTHKQFFYERVWDAYALDHEISRKDTLEPQDIIALTRGAFTRDGIRAQEQKQKYLTFTRLQLDAQYVAAAVINEANEQFSTQETPAYKWYDPRRLFANEPDKPLVLRFGDRYGSQQQLLAQQDQRLRAAVYAADAIFSGYDKNVA